MARIEDIVDEAVAADPKSSLRNLKHYELAGAEFEWRDCTQRVPEKGEIQGPGGDMINPDQVGKDDCFVVVNGKFYRVYDEAYFEAEYKRWNYDRYAPPAQCLDLLRDVYDEEFFNYVKRFKRKKGVTGSLIAGKPIEYPEDYRPEFSSEFCYFGSKPRFCRMRPCPVFSSEQYSFNQEHTKALHEEWKKTGVGLWPFEPPHYHEVNSSRLCTKVTNILRPREEKDEAIRDMGFPVLHAALNGVLEEIKTLTKEGKNTCAYCGAQVEQGREYCPSTIRRECYDAYYDDVKRPKLKPVNSTGDRGVALTD